MAVVSSGSPLAARRKLGAELRILRDRSGLTTEEVGAHLNCHNSKISRIELAKRTCTRKDFAGLMELYEVDEAKRAELSELLTRAMQRIPLWWQAYADVISATYAEFLAYESEAVRCWEYQPLLIPGLLQTQGYARAITGPGFAALGPDQVDSLVEVRMRRQERLRDEETLTLDALVTEAALRLQVGGPKTIRAQLRHLVEVASLPNVTFRVIPFEAGENGASTGAFTLFSDGKENEGDVAFMESAEATTFRDDALALRRLNRLFRNLSAAALSEHDTLKLVERIEKEQ
ncbi:helix-turn-helix transcriptional regulator [Streptomyces sp. XD-27]|uniref:helix-turn-helix domain-containing protein n=1 Tax=Streptomyces sp. XD-27 TaxID=3062779 RepID=UPI0026F462EE|nr:helix-turn-helix transcriptional regulator [Streptomyces sp. XD-27]WKX70060.1 helix-turn-helix transcriptional regulator [Streptomyces sp. XD-27]